jgi:hypothetical protein
MCTISRQVSVELQPSQYSSWFFSCLTECFFVCNSGSCCPFGGRTGSSSILWGVMVWWSCGGITSWTTQYAETHRWGCLCMWSVGQNWGISGLRSWNCDDENVAMLALAGKGGTKDGLLIERKCWAQSHTSQDFPGTACTTPC